MCGEIECNEGVEERLEGPHKLLFLAGKACVSMTM